VRRARAFAAFWCDFLVGDDWQLTAAVVLALVVASLLSGGVDMGWWWVVPAFAAVALPFSLWRAVRASRRAEP
jgi:hypothetical protein